jgi:uncharacterized Zn finger protein
MGSRVVYATNGRYVVTAKGRDDLRRAEQCECQLRITGLLVECPECGTVYGYTRESSMSNSPYARKDG